MLIKGQRHRKATSLDSRDPTTSAMASSFVTFNDNEPSKKVMQSSSSTTADHDDNIGDSNVECSKEIAHEVNTPLARSANRPKHNLKR